MKKNYAVLGFLLTFLVATLFSFDALAGKKSILLSTSESDAEIYIDGQLMGKGHAEVIVLSKSCVTVQVKKMGFLTGTITFCHKKNHATPPKSYYFQMERDDAYDASVQTDIANVDIELKTDKSEVGAWKLISMIITSYFDVINRLSEDFVGS